MSIKRNYLVRVTENLNHDYEIVARSRDEAIAIYQTFNASQLVERDTDRSSSWDTPWDVEDLGEVTTPIIGINCAVTYHDSPDGFEDVYISFSEALLNHEGEPAEEDIYGVSDDSIFYYLNKEEQTSLVKFIADGAVLWSTNEWYIDLAEDYELIYEGAK